MTGTVFRLASDADLDAYESWFADAELARRLSRPTPAWRAYVRQPGCAFWVALDAAVRPIAAFQTERAEDGAVYFDCAIDPARRGRGLMQAIFADFLAGTIGDATRLIAEAETDNHASLRLLRRAGFQETTEGATDGFIRFALLRQDSLG